VAVAVGGAFVQRPDVVAEQFGQGVGVRVVRSGGCGCWCAPVRVSGIGHGPECPCGPVSETDRTPRSRCAAHPAHRGQVVVAGADQDADEVGQDPAVVDDFLSNEQLMN